MEKETISIILKVSFFADKSSTKKKKITALVENVLSYNTNEDLLKVTKVYHEYENLSGKVCPDDNISSHP